MPIPKDPVTEPETHSYPPTETAATKRSDAAGENSRPSTGSLPRATGNGCAECDEHRQAAIDAMSLANDMCEQREQIIHRLMRVCYDEANRIANHCSDGAARWAMTNLYEAGNRAKQYLKSVRVEKASAENDQAEV